MFVSDEARHHPFMSEAERTYILENHAKKEKSKEDTSVNILKICDVIKPDMFQFGLKVFYLYSSHHKIYRRFSCRCRVDLS